MFNSDTLKIMSEGDDFYKQNKFDLAINKYQKALNIEPGNINIQRKIIDTYKRFNYQKAILESIRLADVYKKNHDYEAAITILKDILDFLNQFNKPPSYSGRRDLYGFKFCLEYEAELYKELGLVYLAKGDLDNAREILNTSLNKNPKSPEEIYKYLEFINLK